MKKILSFFTVGAAILGTSSNFIVACNHQKSMHSATLTPAEGTLKPATKRATKKLNLNDLKIYGLDHLTTTGFKWPNTKAKIWIDGKKAYLKVENEIINDYNHHFLTKKHLTANDFALNSTALINKKTWALQISNGSTIISNHQKTNLNVTNLDNLSNNDNSLNIKIFTSNLNVVGQHQKIVAEKTITSSTIKGYLQPFIYTNKEVNHNHNITALQEAGRTANQQQLLKRNVIDFSSGLDNLNLDFQDSPLYSSVLKIMSSKANRLKISNAVLNNINPIFKQRMKHLIALHKATLAKKLTNLDSKNFIAIDSWHVQIIQVLNFDDSVWIWPSQKKATEQGKYFLQIKVYNWKYLTKNSSCTHYLTLNSTDVYGYLGAHI